MTLKIFLVRSELAYQEHMLLLLQTEGVDLLAHLRLRLQEFLPKLFYVSIPLLQLSLSFLCDLLFHTQHFFQDVNVLLESAGDLLVLLEFVSQENLDAA